MIATAYAFGAGNNPADGTAFAFIGPTTTIAITATNQALWVSAQKALGTTNNGGASNLRLSVCQRVNGSGATPAVASSGDDITGLAVSKNDRVPFSLAAVFTGLAAATYEVGMCGYTVTGNATNWNSNGAGRITAFVAQK